MGAAMIAPLIGSLVSSVFSPPPPAPVIIAPPQAQPWLTSEQAQQIAKTAEQQGQTFGQGMLQSILNRAKSQGVGDKEMTSIKDEFNTWFGKNQDEINKSLQLTAAHSKAQADYINTVNQNNLNTQMQALQDQQPQGGFGRLLGGLASSAMGGMFGGGGMGASFAAPQMYQAPPMISGPDTTDFTA